MPSLCSGVGDQYKRPYFGSRNTTGDASGYSLTATVGPSQRTEGLEAHERGSGIRGGMATFLFTVWPFQGHVHPDIAIAHGLRERGHEAAFYTGCSARAALEVEGFRRFLTGSCGSSARPRAGRPSE